MIDHGPVKSRRTRALVIGVSFFVMTISPPGAAPPKFVNRVGISAPPPRVLLRVMWCRSCRCLSVPVPTSCLSRGGTGAGERRSARGLALVAREAAHLRRTRGRDFIERFGGGRLSPAPRGASCARRRPRAARGAREQLAATAPRRRERVRRWIDAASRKHRRRSSSEPSAIHAVAASCAGSATTVGRALGSSSSWAARRLAERDSARAGHLHGRILAASQYRRRPPPAARAHASGRGRAGHASGASPRGAARATGTPPHDIVATSRSTFGERGW